MEHNACLELALEGERLCKNGDFSGGVAFFEGAIRVGTDDLKTLSAIYSQLGNAYFYLGDYTKAMDYHRCDLTVARAIGDELGEGKASGNLGNTLKVMGNFDEAVTCCERHLSISRKLQDQVGEGRALYNLGNVYHAKGKRFACMGHQDPGDFPEEVKQCLLKAVDNYDLSLKIMLELEDRSAQGRACGNLGNTHYLLGNFNEAITYHNERLKIAKEFGDLAAERRAHNNLGNAHIFLGEFEIAAEHYKKTLAIAIELRDKAIEAQAYYSLGNTYTLLHEYPTAIEYHLKHLRIAQELKDRIGESRAYWSLGNAHSAIGDHEQAIHFANQHLLVSREIGDHSGELAAQQCVSDSQKALLESRDDVSNAKTSPTDDDNSNSRMRRISMEHMDLLKLTPDAKGKKPSTHVTDKKLSPVTETTVPKAFDVSETNMNSLAPVKETKATTIKGPTEVDDSLEEESFFDQLSRFQSKRMDDQRCSLTVLSLAEDKENSQLLGNSLPVASADQPCNPPKKVSNIDRENNHVREDLFDMIAGMQSRRLDEQRASLPGLTHFASISEAAAAAIHNNNNTIPPGQGLHRPSDDVHSPDDDFFEMLMRCQASRIEDQRSSMPDIHAARPQSMYNTMSHCNGGSAPAPRTVPDEDFLNLIMRLQSGRIEDQRTALPPAVAAPSVKSGILSLRSSLKSAGKGGSLKR